MLARFFFALAAAFFTASPGGAAPPPDRTCPSLRAIDELGLAADKAGDSLPPLVGLLSSADAAERWHAARALGNLGVRAKSAAPRLAELLNDGDPVVVVHAALALARIGDKSEQTLKTLIAKLTDKDERVSRTALQVLRELDAPPRDLAAALEAVLQSGDAAVMSHAVEAIVGLGGDATPFLKAALAEEASAYWAAIAISEIGPPAAGTAPALVELLGRSDDAETRQLALVALGKIGPAAARASRAVLRIAREVDEDGQRIAACYAAGAIGDKSAGPLLRELERSGGPFQAMVCAWSLAKIQPDNPAAQAHALGLVVGGLQSDREAVRNAAAAGLRELGAPPAEASAALIDAVRSATPQQRSNIALAMASLGPDVVPKAVEALSDPELRGVAIEVLGRLGVDAKGGVAGLRGVLKADVAGAVAQAQYALAAIGEGAADAAADIAANLTDDDTQVRQSALFALRRIGPAAQPAADRLGRLLEGSQDAFERFAAAWALAKLKLEPRLRARVTQTLGEALESPSERVRLETISAISDLSPAEEALNEKLRMLAGSDPSFEVRHAAGGALGR